MRKPPSPSEGEGKKKSREFPFSSCLKFFIRHPEVFALKLFRPLVEPLRSDAPSLVIPEIFNRESMLFLFLLVLNTVDPGLKIAGVTDEG